MDVLLGGDGSAVSSSGEKVPLGQSSQNNLIDWAEALEHLHVGNVSRCIDNDFYYDISAFAGKQIGLNHGIEGDRGQGGPNLETCASPIRQRSKRRAYCSCLGEGR